MHRRRTAVAAAALLVAALVASAALGAHAYKPVLLMHGIFSGASDLQPLVDNIQKYHPGTEVTNFAIYQDLESLEAMWTQAQTLAADIKSATASYTDGYHVIGFSQGGLLSRTAIQMLDGHQVHTFIGLSSPLNGQFGDTDYTRYLFPNLTRDELYHVFYTSEAQNSISIADYWRDPFQTDEFMQDNIFMPVINNLVSSADSARYKANFERIEQVVLISGPDDGVIQPWVSAHFGFYDQQLGYVDMTQTDEYTRDTYGLRTLDTAGRIKMYTISGVEHTHWYRNDTVFQENILPYLI